MTNAISALPFLGRRSPDASYRLPLAPPQTASDPSLPLAPPEITVWKRGTRSLQLDLTSADAAFANAIRRTLLSSLPTIAVETVSIILNTGIMHDEVLAHRLGLIPIRCDPSVMDFKYKGTSFSPLPFPSPLLSLHLAKKRVAETTFSLSLSFSLTEDGQESWTDKDTIVFNLNVTCKFKVDAPATAELPDDLYLHHNVFSSDLEWMPHGSQQQYFPQGVEVANKEILLTRLRPGQTVHAELLCTKGWGGDHAKWSPVGTSSSFYSSWPPCFLFLSLCLFLYLPVDNCSPPRPLFKKQQPHFIGFCP